MAGNNKGKTTVRSFHIVLATGVTIDGASEVNRTGADLVVRDGALIVQDNDADAKVVFAPGTWARGEREGQDDK